MKAIIFITCLALVSCQYENELPAPVEYPQPEYRSVSNQLDSARSTLATTFSTTTGLKIQAFKYTATQEATANIKLHLWLSNPSYGFQYFITKNGKSVGRNDVGNKQNFSGARDIVVLDLSLSPGDVIESNVGFSSGAETTVYPTGTHLGFPNDSSYFLIETF